MIPEGEALLGKQLDPGLNLSDFNISRICWEFPHLAWCEATSQCERSIPAPVAVMSAPSTYRSFRDSLFQQSGETTPGGIIGTILDERLLRDSERMEFTNTTFRISWPFKPRVTTVYARATHAALEAAVKRLIEPIAQWVEFERRARIRVVAHLWLIDQSRSRYGGLGKRGKAW